MSKKKSTKIKFKEITCAFCQGKGKDPFQVPSKLSDCQVCLGKGTNTFANIALETCGACRRTGIFAHHRLPCSVCKGKGVIPEDRRSGKKGLTTDSGLPEIGNY